MKTKNDLSQTRRAEYIKDCKEKMIIALQKYEGCIRSAAKEVGIHGNYHAAWCNEDSTILNRFQKYDQDYAKKAIAILESFGKETRVSYSVPFLVASEIKKRGGRLHLIKSVEEA